MAHGITVDEVAKQTVGKNFTRLPGNLVLVHPDRKSKNSKSKKLQGLHRTGTKAGTKKNPMLHTVTKKPHKMNKMNKMKAHKMKGGKRKTLKKHINKKRLTRRKRR